MQVSASGTLSPVRHGERQTAVGITYDLEVPQEFLPAKAVGIFKVGVVHWRNVVTTAARRYHGLYSQHLTRVSRPDK